MGGHDCFFSCFSFLLQRQEQNRRETAISTLDGNSCMHTGPQTFLCPTEYGSWASTHTGILFNPWAYLFCVTVDCMKKRPSPTVRPCGQQQCLFPPLSHTDPVLRTVYTQRLTTHTFLHQQRKMYVCHTRLPLAFSSSRFQLCPPASINIQGPKGKCRHSA